MNDEECKSSKPLSEEESQTSPQPAEVTGPELRQESTSSQPETRDLPSFPSSEEETGATCVISMSKSSKPMSEEESHPSPQPAENTQSPVNGSELWQQSTSSQPETHDRPWFESWEEEAGATYATSRFIPVSTDPELADYCLPKSMIDELDDFANALDAPSYSAELMEFIETVLHKAEKESSTDLVNYTLQKLARAINVPAHVLKDMKNESSSTSSELHDSQLTPELEAESLYVRFNINSDRDFPVQISIEPRADYNVPESMIQERDNLMANRTPNESFREAEPRQMESRSEMNLAPTTEEDQGVISRENSLSSESEIRELSSTLRESLNILPEALSDESPEGPPTEKSKNHSK